MSLNHLITNIGRRTYWAAQTLLRSLKYSQPPPRRSSKWPRVRREWLEAHPTCIVCGGTDNLEVHHLLPYHLFPERELDPSNLATMCVSGPGHMNCHLIIGHCGRWTTYNPHTVPDAEWLRSILRNGTKQSA